MNSDLVKAIEHFKNGGFVIVTDDEDRENEGDLFLVASKATTEKIGFMIRNTSGVICVAMTEERSRQLHLPLMVKQNQDTKRTAFTVTVDSKDGLTTGISAEERANTIRALANPDSKAEDFIRPGHIFPLIAVAGGLAERRGHTEAVVELCLRAGAAPVGVISELVNEDGSMMRGAELRKFADRNEIPIITIENLAKSLSPIPSKEEPNFEWARLPRKSNEWRIATFAGRGGVTHAVLSFGDISGAQVLVRIHSECLTGDVFASLRCDCGEQLDNAMERIEKARSGVVIYLREHEGRGIGLAAKIQAYRLQDAGMDTVEANIALGHEIDERDYLDAVDILRALKIRDVRLLTNNPEKISALQESGIKTKVESLIVESNPHNINYLRTKSAKLGHGSSRDEIINNMREER